MVYSYYEEIMAMQEKPATQDELKQKLIELNLYYIFKPAFNLYAEKGFFNKVVYFTTQAYSWESKQIVIGQDPSRYKKKIATSLDIPETMWDVIIDYKNEEINKMFQNFLFLYKENMDFTHLMSYKELYQRAMASIMQTKAAKEGDDEDDDSEDLMDNRMKRMEKANEMLEKIRKLEKKIRDDYKAITLSQEELSKHVRENFEIRTLSVEENAAIIK